MECNSFSDKKEKVKKGDEKSAPMHVTWCTFSIWN